MVTETNVSHICFLSNKVFFCLVLSYYEHIWILSHLHFSLWYLLQPFFKMADSGYCYDAYMLYWREMQANGERLFTNKGPAMVKESENFQNCLLRGHHLSIKVT